MQLKPCFQLNLQANHLDGLEAVPAAQLLKVMLTRPAFGSISCSKKCTVFAGFIHESLCTACKDALLLYRASAAAALECSLQQHGWGYSRA